MTPLQRILISGDAQALRRCFPNVGNERQALITLHLARTKMDSMPLKLRLYSHAWLKDQGIPSMLPDELRPSVEQVGAYVEDVVGISVNSKHPYVQKSIHGVMSDTILDCYANGDTDAGLMKRLMMDARAKERRALGLPNDR